MHANYESNNFHLDISSSDEDMGYNQTPVMNDGQ